MSLRLEESDDPFDVSTWRKANPSFDHMPDLAAVIRSEAEDAKKDPAELASFKALRLNMGTSDVMESCLLDPATWKGIEVEETELKRTGRFVLGLDLG